MFQVLLSQVHRLRALALLGRFLDLGPWAVNLALSVGIFPYVLKLLQSSARELRPLLVFIWAKILAVDNVSCVVFSFSLFVPVCDNRILFHIFSQGGLSHTQMAHHVPIFKLTISAPIGFPLS